MVFQCGCCRCKIEFSFILMIALALVCGAHQLLAVLLFASLHEAGHLLLLYCFHGKVQNLTLSFYGVGIRHAARFSKWQEIAFLSGGIAINALFAAIGICRAVNLPLFLLNALPLYPLDGGRIFALFTGERAARITSLIMLVALFCYAAVMKNISLLMIGVYLLVFTYLRNRI